MPAADPPPGSPEAEAAAGSLPGFPVPVPSAPYGRRPPTVDDQGRLTVPVVP